MTPSRVISLDPAATDILGALDSLDLLADPASVPGLPLDSRGETLVLRGSDGTPDFPQPCRTLVLEARGIEEVIDNCIRVAEAIGRPERGTRAAIGLRNRLFDAAEYVNPYADGPAVAFVGGVNPPVGAGGWVVQMIERAGGRHPWNGTVARPGTGEASGPQHGERRAGAAPLLRGSEFVEHPAEALIFCVDGLGVEDGLAAAEELLASSRYASLRRTAKGRIAVVDGRGTFGRPGPGLAECFEWLVGWLNDRPQLMPASLLWRELRG